MRIFAVFAIAFCLLATVVHSQISKDQRGITTKVINLWPGVAPGSDQWKQAESNLGSDGMGTTVNVSTPTLTAYLPDPSTASDAAVIIAPGGGFLGLIYQLGRSRRCEVAGRPRGCSDRPEIPH